ncbi:hypothetical protein [Chlamydiifrater volucris]|uniref:hypothetical protein n=1 Tax=Chlamydiifrater volucris TaxID=2681470 RepID=UPI001BCCDDA9|nr:hypothetical protein [Chlamydiifrater volucris]
MVNKNDSEESVLLDASFKENSRKLDIQQSTEEGANGTDSGSEGGDPVPPEPNTPEQFFVTTDESVESYVDINMNFLRVSNVGAPTELEHEERSGVADEEVRTYSRDAVRLADTKNLLLRPEYASNIQCLMLKGGTMQGDIDMGDNGITGIDDYYYSGEPTAIASGAALETAVLDYAGSWLSAKKELQTLKENGMDELIKDLGFQNGEITTPNGETCKLLLRDGKSTMTGDLVFIDQDLVGGPVDDVPEGGGNGGSGEGSDDSEEVISGNAEEGIGNENGEEVGDGTEAEEEVPTEPIRNPTITNIKTPEKDTDIVTRRCIDLMLGKLPLSGGTVLGDIDANNYSITNLKIDNSLITTDASPNPMEMLSECLDGLNVEEEIKGSDFSKFFIENELDDSSLVSVSSVIRSFERKYTLNYLCCGLNIKDQSGQFFGKEFVYNDLEKCVGSSGSSNYWEVSTEFPETLKIKKAGVYLLTLTISSITTDQTRIDSECTLSLIGNSGESVGDVLAKFFLEPEGSASVTVLVYVEPSYLGIQEERNIGSEARVLISLDGTTSLGKALWQISYIEDVSENQSSIESNRAMVA